MFNAPDQMGLPGLTAPELAVEFRAREGVEARGAVFTRREVVEFILDLVGYVPSPTRLWTKKLLEPSFGEGDFLLPAIGRLLASYKSFSNSTSVVDYLSDAICGVELHKKSFDITCAKVNDYLRRQGIKESDALALIKAWLHHDDFLLKSFSASFDFVVGNPPYVRQELIPNLLLDEYKRRFSTIYDRADLYVPFIEYGLRLLNCGGQLSFICSDRWVKNKYGGPLRSLIARDFKLRAYVDMTGTQAFHADVSAYPSIFLITRGVAGPIQVAQPPSIDARHLRQLAFSLCASNTLAADSPDIHELGMLPDKGAPWILSKKPELELVRRLEETFPLLEEAGCSVGIGVATGADKVFIAPFDELDVEEDRKLPLVMNKDIKKGFVDWQGSGVVNPFEPDGSLANLSKYPRFARYLEMHIESLKKRHVAKKNPNSWYRTIDKIQAELTGKPKLLFPDIKGQAHIVFEKGNFYPHHNLYFITSDDWDLRALQNVLAAGIANLFVAAYSTRMRGGFLRFQAQYMRRIRLPKWAQVSQAARAILTSEAASENDIALAVSEIYGFSTNEMKLVFGVS